jgi:hypothetical protein
MHVVDSLERADELVLYDNARPAGHWSGAPNSRAPSPPSGCASVTECWEPNASAVIDPRLGTCRRRWSAFNLAGD